MADNTRRASYSIKRRSHAPMAWDSWPRRDVTERDVVLAGGHALDVLPKRDRMIAHREIVKRHRGAYTRLATFGRAV